MGLDISEHSRQIPLCGQANQNVDMIGRIASGLQCAVAFPK
ncbi:uncharacterized protein METZ01_LOCUS360047, partial [marine metagenome]